MNRGLEAIGPRYRQIYVSPHLDDAVLSCGGTIARQVASGQRVLVLNLFVATPDYSEISPWAQVEHNVRGNPPDLLEARLAEDRAVLEALGASIRYLHYLDCIYRRYKGQVLYNSVEAIFGEVAPVEQDMIPQLATDLAAICAYQPRATVYAPLGVGHHVDHQLTRWAALRLIENGYDVCFYEEFPYVETAGAVETALGELPDWEWQPRIQEIDVEVKIQAIAGYATEMDILFGGEDAMAQRVRSYTARVAQGQGYAERFWVPLASVHSGPRSAVSRKPGDGRRLWSRFEPLLPSSSTRLLQKRWTSFKRG